MSFPKRIKSAVARPLRNLVLGGNYWLGNYDDVVWLIGDARSGTTWLMELLGQCLPYRAMFEPFNFYYVEEMAFILPQLYMNPQQANPQLEAVASDVFTGKFQHSWSDSTNRALRYKGLLIKDVWANLFAKWASDRFPEVKVILLIRNPFSVALSKTKTSHWHWIKDPLHLLNQPDLRQDYLEPFAELIEKTSREKDYLMNQILIWAILNVVPLRQFERGELHIVFYEALFQQPNVELAKILGFVQSEAGNAGISLDNNTIKQPSRLSGAKSNLLKGVSPISAWKNELTTAQIDKGLSLLRPFGLAELYGGEGLPQRQVLERFQ